MHVRPIEQRVLSPLQAGDLPVAPEVLQQPDRLPRFVGEGVGSDAVLRLPVGLDLLVEQPRIAGDDLARGLEDLPGAAPVLVEHDLADREVVAEALEDAGVGAGPGVDGLLVVAHGEAVPVGGAEAGDHLVLRQAQVLELIHQQRVPPAADLGRGVGVGAQQLAGQRDEVVVVEQVAQAERRAVVLEVLPVALGERVVLQLVAAEEPEELRLALGADAEPAEDPLLVVLVGEAEAAAQLHQGGVLAEQREAEGVERAAVDLVGGSADLAAEPGGDLVGGLVGEGEGADPLRLDLQDLDEIGDPPDQAVGLTGAGAGDYQDWT